MSCSVILLLPECVLKSTNCETPHEVPSLLFYYHSLTTLFSERMWINNWKCVVIIGWFVLSLFGGLCCHLRMVRVVIIGWFVLSLLGGLCCYYWVVCAVIGWFVLSSLDGSCCHYWVVCAVVFGWFVLSLLGGLCCHY
jgi:hypothetical protein